MKSIVKIAGLGLGAALLFLGARVVFTDGAVRSEAPPSVDAASRVFSSSAIPAPPLPGKASALAARKAGSPGAPPTWPASRGLGGFALALDEIAVRAPGGEYPSQALDPPPATEEKYSARIRALPGDLRPLPVLYAAGREREAARRGVVTGDILVKLPSGKTAAQVCAETGTVLRSEPSYAPGYAVIGAPEPALAPALVLRLEQDPAYEVVELQIARRRARKALPNDPRIGQQWNLKYAGQTDAVSGCDVNIENAWNYGGTGGVRGAGVRIGILDDGLLTSHPDLAANVDFANQWDFADGDNDANPGAGDDHGTAVAGMAGARGNNGRGISGTAPEALLAGIRMPAVADDSAEAEAFAFRNHLIQIKNTSWGAPDGMGLLDGPGRLTRLAQEDAATNGRGGLGTILVVAGGNGAGEGDNSNYDGYANSIYTLAVGAINSRRQRTEYSEPGANLVCVAPSDDSAVNTAALVSTDVFGSYDSFGGTSAAAPTVAGVVALLLAKNPGLSWRDVREILIQTSTRVPVTAGVWTANSAGYSFHHGYGAGLVNAVAAVNAAGSWTNRPARIAAKVSTQTGLNIPIPDNNSTGITRTFNITGAMRVEQVELEFSSTHESRGDLEITLTSPSGMTSRLATVHSSDTDPYEKWVFSSVRHWGELAAGTWTLKVADLDPIETGSLTHARLTLHGTGNPVPSLAVVSPPDHQAVPAGAAVELQVSAQDIGTDLQPGQIARVELYEGAALLATDTTAPFSFPLTPAEGTHTYTLVAVDSEGASSTPVAHTLRALSPYALWMENYPTLADKTPGGNPDGDAFTNEQEFQARTHPGDPKSALRVASLEFSGAVPPFALVWESVAGVRYQAQYSEDLQSWTGFGPVHTATGDETRWSFAPPVPGPGVSFRVIVAPAP